MHISYEVEPFYCFSNPIPTQHVEFFHRSLKKGGEVDWTIRTTFYLGLITKMTKMGLVLSPFDLTTFCHENLSQNDHLFHNILSL